MFKIPQKEWRRRRGGDDEKENKKRKRRGGGGGGGGKRRIIDNVTPIGELFSNDNSSSGPFLK